MLVVLSLARVAVFVNLFLKINTNLAETRKKPKNFTNVDNFLSQKPAKFNALRSSFASGATSRIESSVATVRSVFSALSVAAMTAYSKISNLDFGRRASSHLNPSSRISPGLFFRIG